MMRDPLVHVVPAGQTLRFQVVPPPTDEEVRRARQYLIGTHVIGQQSAGAVLGELVDAWLFGRGLDERSAYTSAIARVTPADVLAIATTFLDPARVIEGVVRGTGVAQGIEDGQCGAGGQALDGLTLLHHHAQAAQHALVALQLAQRVAADALTRVLEGMGAALAEGAGQLGNALALRGVEPAQRRLQLVGQQLVEQGLHAGITHGMAHGAVA